MVKNLSANPGRPGSIHGSGRSPGGGHCPESPVDRGAWPAIVHGVAKSRTGLKRPNTHTQYA